MKFDILVVGGGAAGMFSAGTAAAFGVRVALIDHADRLGKKLGITGKGRCNVTNNCSAEEVLKNIPRNSRFLYSALYGFPPEQAMDFFERRGCALKTERGRRVFPVSDRASDITAVLTDYLEETGVTVLHGSARELLVHDGALCGVRTRTETIYADRVILCTGGCSYPATGSDGSGYRLAEAVGHTIVPPVGSLVPLEEDGTWCQQMQGLSLRNVAVRLTDAKKKTVYEDFGELLFTHFGLSGPTILSASAHMKGDTGYTVHIDLKPALDEQALDQRLLREFEAAQNKNFTNALGGLYPRALIPVMVERSAIDPMTKVNSITRQQRRTLLELTKNFTVKISGRRPVKEAIITAGGVKTSEVDPKTMQSKRQPGLYFAGEVLDVDAYTGGYNLQIAWATAYAAGSAAAEAALNDRIETEESSG